MNTCSGVLIQQDSRDIWIKKAVKGFVNILTKYEL